MSTGLVNFTCPPSLAPHLVHVFSGEYDVALEFTNAPVVLDIGANVGAYSRWSRLRWPNCYIHAYEPNPRCQRILAKNLSRLADGYEIHAVAVMGEGDEPTIRLYQGRNNLGEASVYLETGALADDFVDVPVVYAKDLPQCDVLKADCEGPEPEILDTYLGTHTPPALIAVEYHSAGASRHMQKKLAEAGYRLVKAMEYETHRGVLVWRHEP